MHNQAKTGVSTRDPGFALINYKYSELVYVYLMIFFQLFFPAYNNSTNYNQEENNMTTKPTVEEYAANDLEPCYATLEEQSQEKYTKSESHKTNPEQQKKLSDEVKNILQMLIDADIKTTGKLTAETLDAIATQGYVYRDGNLVKQDALTELQKKAIKIFRKYEKLPMRERIGIIAQAFGCTSGEIKTSPCFGKWRGTSDMFIRFDNGASLFVGNRRTPEAKTKKVQNEYVNDALLKYNPEIIAATKESVLPSVWRAKRALM